MAITKIQVVRTAQQSFAKIPYLIHPFARHWREWGLSVEVTHALLEPAGDDVLVIPHFDLTVRPASYAGPIAKSAHVINRAVVNVSKRIVSRQLVAGPDQYDGPVLVKTDRNYGGLPESSLRALGEDAPTLRPPYMHWSNYAVYDHPRLVPPMVWDYPPLVVEKFLPEKEDGHYCLRQYVFLGDHGIYTRAFSREPIVKSKNVVRREIIEGPPPPEVDAMRERLGFDYGKFDFVIHDGQAIVFDVNPTPTYNPASKAGSQDEIIAGLAQGINSFLDPA